MSQGVLGFKYEEERHDTGMTGLAGLPVYLDLLHAMGSGADRAPSSGETAGLDGCTDGIILKVLLNIAGGDCVEDLGKVQKDEGFCRILRRVEQQGKKRRERREMERRWRKERWRSVPSPSAAFRYLLAFHDQKRDPQKIATLDQDATLVETAKRDALFGYKGFKSYQPLNNRP